MYVTEEQLEIAMSALNTINELNLSDVDERGNVWARSDLIHQEIIAAKRKISELDDKEFVNGTVEMLIAQLRSGFDNADKDANGIRELGGVLLTLHEAADWIEAAVKRENAAEKWLEYPDNIPEESGYYPTYYQNMKTKEFFYKAIAWYRFEWAEWNENIDIKVIAFIPSMRADYYTQIIPDESWFNYSPER